MSQRIEEGFQEAGGHRPPRAQDPLATRPGRPEGHQRNWLLQRRIVDRMVGQLRPSTGVLRRVSA